MCGDEHPYVGGEHPYGGDEHSPVRDEHRHVCGEEHKGDILTDLTFLQLYIYRFDFDIWNLKELVVSKICTMHIANCCIIKDWNKCMKYKTKI